MVRPPKSFILISKPLDSLFSGFNPSSGDVYFCEQITTRILSLVRENDGEMVVVLCVAGSDEISQLQGIFQTSEESRLKLYYTLLTEVPCEINLTKNLAPLLDYRFGKISETEWAFILQKFQDLQVLTSNTELRRTESCQESDQIMDQDALIRIGKSLSSERDPDKLLRTILFLSKKITGADAGSIFLAEEKEGMSLLRFKYSHTFSKDLGYEEFTMPLDGSSIAGYVALSGTTLNLPDVYQMGEGAPVTFNSKFDQLHGYRTKSMLVTPMTNHQGKTIGVIQLINSKESFDSKRNFTGNEAFEIVLKDASDFEVNVVPFEKRYEDLMQAVAGQAAIAIENNRMIRQIEQQFEEFVKASVFAIESRDPATSGHSIRVAMMCILLAEAVNQEKEGPYKDVTFSHVKLKELYYAALLHDFGKVYIDLAVFMKAKKLTPQQMEILRYRVALIYRSLELEHIKEEVKCLKNGLPLPTVPAQSFERLKNLWFKVNELVEPEVTNRNRDEEIQEMLAMVQDIYVNDLDGKPVPVLTDDEVMNLKIARGSLNDEERSIIQSHVVHTFNFVNKIPWPDELAEIPQIAVKHHEMLDGSGYPYQLKGDEIPLTARIMSLSDVFDALAASDRPYKKAMPLEKVLAILSSDAEKGKLDKDLVKLFLDKQLYLQHKRFEPLETGTLINSDTH